MKKAIATAPGKATKRKDLTKSEKNAVLKEQKEEEEKAKNTLYRFDRQNEYPAIGEQLDAIWKTLNQMRLDGQQLPQDGDDMLGKILAVKNKFPKPENKNSK